MNLFRIAYLILSLIVLSWGLGWFDIQSHAVYSFKAIAKFPANCNGDPSCNNAAKMMEFNGSPAGQRYIENLEVKVPTEINVGESEEIEAKFALTVVGAADFSDAKPSYDRILQNSYNLIAPGSLKRDFDIKAWAKLSLDHANLKAHLEFQTASIFKNNVNFENIRNYDRTISIDSASLNIIPGGERKFNMADSLFKIMKWTVRAD